MFTFTNNTEVLCTRCSPSFYLVVNIIYALLLILTNEIWKINYSNILFTSVVKEMLVLK